MEYNSAPHFIESSLPDRESTSTSYIDNDTERKSGIFRRLLTTSLAALALHGAMPSTAEAAKDGYVHQNEYAALITKAPHQKRIQHGKQHTQRDKQNHVRLKAPDSTPHLTISLEDDTPVTSGDIGRTDRVLSLGRAMGATSWRLMVHPADFLNNTLNYDFTSDQIAGHHLRMSVTPSCEGMEWTDATFRNYMAAIGKQFGDRENPATNAIRFSVCNEPNYADWLQPMPGMTVAETYSHLYPIGYKALKEQAPDAKVMLGSLNSQQRPLNPLDFLQTITQCAADETCPPIITDGVVFNLYQLTSKPTKPSPVPGEVGIGSLQEVVETVSRLYAKGRIETSEHTQPPIYIDEFGYMVSTRPEEKQRLRAMKRAGISSVYSKRYMSDRRRAKYYREVIRMVCQYEEVAGLSFYGFESPEYGWGGLWNTSLLKPNGTLLKASYNALKSSIHRRSDCIKQKR